MPSSLLMSSAGGGGRRRCLENRGWRIGLEGRCRLNAFIDSALPALDGTRPYSTGAAPTGPPPDANYDGGIEGQDQDRSLQQKEEKQIIVTMLMITSILSYGDHILKCLLFSRTSLVVLSYSLHLSPCFPTFFLSHFSLQGAHCV